MDVCFTLDHLSYRDVNWRFNPESLEHLLNMAKNEQKTNSDRAKICKMRPRCRVMPIKKTGKRNVSLAKLAGTVMVINAPLGKKTFCH